MKKLFVTILILTAAALSASVYAGTPIKQSELPKTAQSFIAKYFAGDVVKKVEKDNGRRGTEYEVDFNSGAEVEYTSEGNWKEVKAAKCKAVPSDIVPTAITKYVDANFKGQSIVEISRKHGGYEIELSGGKELKLTEDAKPLQTREGNRGQGGRGQGGRGQGGRTQGN